jgi:hypothetical protein
MVVYIYLFMQCLTVYLSYKDFLPAFLANTDKKTDEVKVVISIVYCHCLDYNSFKTTLILNTIITLPFVYIILKEQVKLRFDPYTTESQALDKEYFSSQLFMYVLYLVATTSHHYLV